MAGTIATLSMVRENFPEFSVDIITISVVYPGADPEEVEEGISLKIEEALEGLEGGKQTTTESRENTGVTIVEVKADYDTGDVLDRVRAQGGCDFPPCQWMPKSPLSPSLPSRSRW